MPSTLVPQIAADLPHGRGPGHSGRWGWRHSRPTTSWLPWPGLCSERGGRCVLVTADKDCRQVLSEQVQAYNIRKNEYLRLPGAAGLVGHRAGTSRGFHGPGGRHQRQRAGRAGNRSQVRPAAFGKVQHLGQPCWSMRPRFRRGPPGEPRQVSPAGPFEPRASAAGCPQCRWPSIGRPGGAGRRAASHAAELFEEFGFRRLADKLSVSAGGRTCRVGRVERAPPCTAWKIGGARCTRPHPTESAALPPVANHNSRTIMESMRVIGMLGGVASGKSWVAQQLAALGAGVLDADRAGHEVLRLPEIEEAARQRWGAVIFAADGHVERGRLAEIVFAPGPRGAVGTDILGAIDASRDRHSAYAASGRLAGRRLPGRRAGRPVASRSGLGYTVRSVAVRGRTPERAASAGDGSRME